MDFASKLDALSKFGRDHPDPKCCGFAIMPFGADTLREMVLTTIKSEFLRYGITIMRADEVDYNPKVWGNIETYIHGCGFGVAIFDGRDQNQFNPNVSNEIGYMMALAKPILLLKEKSVPSLNVDIADNIYSVFDIRNVSSSLPRIIDKFVRDYKIGQRNEVMAVTFSISDVSEDQLKAYQDGLELFLPPGSVEFLRYEKGEQDGKIKLSFSANNSAYERMEQIVGKPLMESLKYLRYLGAQETRATM